MPAQIREVGELYSSGSMDKHALGQKVRYIRKSLSPYCFEDKGKKGKKGKASGQKNKVNNTGPSWDFWSSVASGLGLSQKYIPSFSQALKESADSDIPPYFNLESDGVSYRVRMNENWVKKQLIKILSSSVVGRMISVCQDKGKEYSVKDWKIGILSSLGKTKTQVAFEAPSSSLGEYVDNRNEMKRAYKAALDQNLLGLLRRARKSGKGKTKKSQILAATYFDKIGDFSGIPYFWAKAASIYSSVSKNSEETRSLAKIIKKHPNHDLKFWIINRIVLFDKKSSKEIKGILPNVANFGAEGEASNDDSKLKNVLKVAGPVAIGFAIGLL